MKAFAFLWMGLICILGGTHNFATSNSSDLGVIIYMVVITFYALQIMVGICMAIASYQFGLFQEIFKIVCGIKHLKNKNISVRDQWLRS